MALAARASLLQSCWTGLDEGGYNPRQAVAGVGMLLESSSEGRGLSQVVDIGRHAVIYSVGHSDHTLEAFVALLHGAGIRTVVDVRSQPYSRWAPQFNRESLASGLQAAGIAYLFWGEALGGRPSDAALYPLGDLKLLPDYALVAATPAFRERLDDLIALAEMDPPDHGMEPRTPVAMMCSEGDYHHCHRAKLITQQLLARGVRVVHLLPDGRQEEASLAPPDNAPQQLSLF